MRLRRTILPLLLVMLGFAGASSAAQSGVTSNDIERLQDGIYDASRDVTALRSRDAALASELQTQLHDLRDGGTALRVKVRKNEPASRSDYSDLRDRIERLRTRARSDEDSPSTPPPPAAP